MAKKANIEPKDALVNGATVEETVINVTKDAEELEGTEGEENEGTEEEAPIQAELPKAKTLLKSAVVTQKVKGVRIHTIEPVDCYIASTHVSIAKDKDTEVASDVAAILVNAKKAYRV